MVELRKKSKADLLLLLKDLYKERFSLRMNAHAETLKTHHFSRIRKMIARIKTCLAEEVNDGAS
ncbi:MAG: 50S ribosomal protein L29 [Legionellales bacterium]|nr:50S ribosomal protein L29 [Legionellales bacterium]